VELTCVTYDCADAGAVARFWSAALRWPEPVVMADGSGAVCRPAGDGMYLEFIRVPERKKVKNRVHVGCHVHAVDALDAEIERLVALGASVAWEEDFPPEIATRYRNVVLRDVEGNEFCLGGGSWAEEAV
jgi:hypothetical protein